MSKRRRQTSLLDSSAVKKLGSTLHPTEEECIVIDDGGQQPPPAVVVLDTEPPLVRDQTVSTTFPGDIGSKAEGPSTPILPCFPNNPDITNKKYTKCFLSKWYTNGTLFPVNWISYSAERDRVFCFACCHFNPVHSASLNCQDVYRHQEILFTIEGFNKWSKAVTHGKGLYKHHTSVAHQVAMKRWSAFQNNPVPIRTRLDPHRPDVIAQNTEYFTMLVDYIRYFCLQELPYRHRDEHDIDATNRGNYQEFIQLMIRTNPKFKTLREHVLSQYSSHVDYTSKTIFNVFVSIMATMVKDLILTEVEQSGTFYVMIDECKDNDDHEQIAFCVRLSNGGVPKERFVAMIRIKEQFDAATIVATVRPQIEQLSSVALFLGMCTDGPNVMIGKHNGVAAQLRAIYPWMINNHCGGHKVNLSTGDVVKKDVPKTVSLLNQLHSAFNSAKTSDIFEKIQKANNEEVRKIAGYIEVRWESLSNTTDAVVDRYRSILESLAVSGEESSIHGTTCAGLYHRMCSADVLMDILILNKLLAMTKLLSKALQSSTITYTQANSEVTTTINALKRCSTDEEFINEVHDEVKAIIEKCCLPDTEVVIYQTRHKTRQMTQQTLPGMLAKSAPTAAKTLSLKEKVSRKVSTLFGSTYKYFQKRFGDQEILVGLDGLDATSPDKYLKYSVLKPLVEKYAAVLKLNQTSTQMELHHISGAPEKYAASSHPNVAKLLSIKNTIAASSCTPERVFSAMNRVKTPKRSSLVDSRTAELVLLSYEKELTKELDLSTVLKKFKEQENRRVPL